MEVVAILWHRESMTDIPDYGLVITDTGKSIKYVKERTCENQCDNPSLFRCSECDDVREVWEPSYCPNCGAKVVSK